MAKKKSLALARKNTPADQVTMTLIATVTAPAGTTQADAVRCVQAMIDIGYYNITGGDSLEAVATAAMTVTIAPLKL